MESKNPLVTIIALCFNQARYLEETLNSIKSQSYSNIELIIIDDASNDGSQNLIRRWIGKMNEKCLFIEHDKNIGICKSLNEGLRLAKGVYYQGIACDDVLFPEKIQKQVSIMEGNPQYSFVYSDAQLMNAQGNWYLYGPKFIQTNVYFFNLPPANLFEKLLLEKNFIPAPSVLIRKKFVEEFGGYDENISFEDYDMWLRLSKKYEAFFLEQTTCLYRVHDKNMTHFLGSENLHLISKFEILFKHIKINAELDAAIEVKLYSILIQLFYNGYRNIKFYSVKFYGYFKKDKNLKLAISLPFGRSMGYRILSRLLYSK